MGGGTCPFGGTPGALLDLDPILDAPAVGYRVVSGHVWWRLTHWEWRRYLALKAAAIPATPPKLAPYAQPGTGVYFTDRQSLQGIQAPAVFAWRLGLSIRIQAECNLFGCAIIGFATPGPLALQAPSPSYPGVRAGLTVGGAREWRTHHDLVLDASMTVTYVEPTGKAYQLQL